MTDKNIIITFEDFSDKLDAPYRLVLLASKRAKEIIREAKVQGKILEMKPTELALRNILYEGIEGAMKKAVIPESQPLLETEQSPEPGEEQEQDEEEEINGELTEEPETA